MEETDIEKLKEENSKLKNENFYLNNKLKELRAVTVALPVDVELEEKLNYFANNPKTLIVIELFKLLEQSKNKGDFETAFRVLEALKKEADFYKMSSLLLEAKK